jgi:hypothetical protein
VRKVTDCGLSDWGSIFGRGRISFISYHIRTTCVTHSLSFQLLHENVVQWKARVNVTEFLVSMESGEFCDWPSDVKMGPSASR